MSQLLEEREYYKPFVYPWAFEFYKKQQQMHWLPEEVPLQDDIKDYKEKLSEGERSLIDNIFSSLPKLMLMCAVDMLSIIYPHLNNPK
jgi:ribonucleotide reductase beta subunit family protein with ferritin-like domain